MIDVLYHYFQDQKQQLMNMHCSLLFVSSIFIVFETPALMDLAEDLDNISAVVYPIFEN